MSAIALAQMADRFRNGWLKTAMRSTGLAIPSVLMPFLRHRQNRHAEAFGKANFKSLGSGALPSAANQPHRP